MDLVQWDLQVSPVSFWSKSDFLKKNEKKHNKIRIVNNWSITVELTVKCLVKSCSLFINFAAFIFTPSEVAIF